jgi:hypothetical protein
MTMSEDRYRLVPVREVGAPQRRVLVGAAVGTTADLTHLPRMPLGSLASFRTLADHTQWLAVTHHLSATLMTGSDLLPGWIARFQRKLRTLVEQNVKAFPIGPEDLGHAAALVRTLAEVGLLERERDVVTRCCVAERSEEATITTVAIPTANRPDVLRRALQTFWRNHAEWGRRPRYLIVDSSTGSTWQTIEQLRGEARARGLSFTCDSAGHRRAYAQRLAASSGVGLDVVSFALLGSSWAPITVGASRNHISLQTAGELCLQTDDDTVCDLRCHSAFGPTPGLALGGSHGAWEYYFEHDHPPITPAHTDYLAAHESVLGRSIGALAASAVGEHAAVDVTRASSDLVRDIETSEATVVATVAGCAGDSGQACPLGLLLLDGDSRRRLLHSRRGYARTMLTGRVIRMVDQITVADHPWCMALSLGVDNRRPLVPFLPIGRNEDGLFAHMLAATEIKGYTAFLPWLIGHERPDSTSDPTRRHATARFRLADVCIALVHRWARGLRSTPTLARRRTLGRWFVDMSNLSPSSFRELLRDVIVSASAAQIRTIEDALDANAGWPRRWAHDLRGFSQHLIEHLAREQAELPHDVVEAVGLGRALASVRETFALFGQLITAWDHLHGTAFALREAAEELHQ